jgi:hypothetical protein
MKRCTECGVGLQAADVTEANIDEGIDAARADCVDLQELVEHLSTLPSDGSHAKQDLDQAKYELTRVLELLDRASRHRTEERMEEAAS